MAVKLTLLEIVQNILNAMSGDEVNSITDTEESEQVAEIVKSTYRLLMSNSNWPHTRRAVSLTARSDSNFPTHMTINEDVKEVISIRYNAAESGETRRRYKELTYLDTDKFLNKLNARNNDDANVDIITDDSGIELLIVNNKAPEYYTSFDDVNVIFDSYDSGVDTTLQDSKFQAQGFIIPEFTVSDSFVPDLPPDGFALLEEEAKSRAQFELRQFQDAKAEQAATKQSRWMSRKAWTLDGGIQYPSYGRRK